MGGLDRRHSALGLCVCVRVCLSVWEFVYLHVPATLSKDEGLKPDDGTALSSATAF